MGSDLLAARCFSLDEVESLANDGEPLPECRDALARLTTAAAKFEVAIGRPEQGRQQDPATSYVRHLKKPERGIAKLIRRVPPDKVELNFSAAGTKILLDRPDFLKEVTASDVPEDVSWGE